MSFPVRIRVVQQKKKGFAMSKSLLFIIFKYSFFANRIIFRNFARRQINGR